jgi:E2F/DP family winged-helix DNA-binding domain
LVTPTPKKHSYSRKNKSLGLLCENFIQTYNTSQVAISIDDAARALGVERRRIYDIINIFESLDIVARKCKNTYNWLGISNLPHVFGRLQEEAFEEFAQDAVDHGLLQISADKIPDRVIPQKRSLGRLSQQFLQLFLAGHPVMALTDASDKILGESTVEDLAAVRIYIFALGRLYFDALIYLLVSHSLSLSLSLSL